MRWHIVIFLVLTSLFTSSAQAADSPPRNAVLLVLGATSPIGLTGTPFGLPPSGQTGLRVARRLGKPLSWMVEGGMSTPFTAFTPSVYVATGPGLSVAPKTTIGFGVAWQMTPSFANAPASHRLGASLGPMMGFDWGAALFPIGLSCPVSSPSACSASVGVRVLPKIHAW